MTKDNETMEQMELSDEMLESVIGGVTRSQRLGTEKFANDAKRNGLTLDEAVDRALHPRRGHSMFTEEMIKYLIEYWNTNLT